MTMPSKDCKHNWEHHCTSYRCGVEEYSRRCRLCSRWEERGVWDSKKGEWIDEPDTE